MLEGNDRRWCPSVINPYIHFSPQFFDFFLRETFYAFMFLIEILSEGFVVDIRVFYGFEWRYL
jgi:hypothetical protein